LIVRRQTTDHLHRQCERHAASVESRNNTNTVIDPLLRDAAFYFTRNDGASTAPRLLSPKVLYGHGAEEGDK